MKKCVKCKIEKDESDFYKSKRAKDGLLCYCKDCSREITKIAARIWRLKNKDVYTKKNNELNWSKYYDKRKLLREQYPEKVLAQNATQIIETKEGLEKHHWSYNEEHRLDIIYLTKSIHRVAHRHMIYDQERMMFRRLDGVLLDTKEDHLFYIDEISKCY